MTADVLAWAALAMATGSLAVSMIAGLVAAAAYRRATRIAFEPRHHPNLNH